MKFRLLAKDCKAQRPARLQNYTLTPLSRHGFTIFVMLVMLVGKAVQAHEIRPAVADLIVAETPSSQLILKIDFNAELFLSGVDASEIVDTDNAPESASYDNLRSLTADALTTRFVAAWPAFRSMLTGRADDTNLDFQLVSFTVSDDPDPRLPRSSQLTITAPLAAHHSKIQFGWASALGALVLRQQDARLDPSQLYTAYLAPGSLSAPIARQGITPQSQQDIIIDYIKIGFIHILPRGFDHILFVLGLFFFAARWRPILTQVTLFTAAHTITLALATTGVITISAAIIEPLIAASIVYVAFENLRSRVLHPSRLVVIFGFGLLHGLGFASVLGEIGLPADQFLTSLISFNIGVELGQLAVLVPVYLVFALFIGDGMWFRRVVAAPASCLIAAIGLWMLVSRLIGS